MNWKLVAKVILGGSLAMFSGFCMAEPVTAFIAANATAFQVVSTVMSVVGAINQGQQASAAARYNAQVAENNAIAARNQAAADADAQQRRAKKQIGAMAAGYGASGVTLEGSALDVIEESTRMAELDRMNIIYGGENRASGYESTARLDRYRGESAARSGYMKAGSELLMGAARVGASGGYGGGSSGFNSENTFDDGSMMRAMKRTG